MCDYCSVDDVKGVLKIDEAEASEDTELTDIVSDASDKVDRLLQVHDLIVPAEVPTTIKRAAKFFAAWEYRRRRDPEAAQIFWYDAQEAIKEYVEAANAERFKPYVGLA